MALVHDILNLTALLLWLNWRAIKLSRFSAPLGPTLLSTLRPAERYSHKRWGYFAGLIGLVLVRSLLYWNVGPGLNWTPKLPIGPIVLSFRSDNLGRITLFSCLSFLVWLGVFYSCLLLLSLANSTEPDTSRPQRFVRAQLGWLERLPAFIKILLPALIVIISWAGLCSWFRYLGLLPPTRLATRAWEQGAVLSVQAYLVWKWPLIFIFVVGLVQNHVYLGESDWCRYVEKTSQNLLSSLAFIPLRIARVDLSHLLAISVVLVASYWTERALIVLYSKVVF